MKRRSSCSSTSQTAVAQMLVAHIRFALLVTTSSSNQASRDQLRLMKAGSVQFPCCQCPSFMGTTKLPNQGQLNERKRPWHQFQVLFSGWGWASLLKMLVPVCIYGLACFTHLVPQLDSGRASMPTVASWKHTSRGWSSKSQTA